jgi:arylsulfatase A-like enzyme
VTHPNLLLITVDALRADHVRALGYGRDTTPNIDRLARQGTLFTQAVANGPTTPFSIPGMIASIHGFQLGRVGLPATGQRTLAEHLNAAGYATACWSPNPYISRAYNYHRGFETFRDPENWSRTSEKARQKVLAFVKRYPALRRVLRKANQILTGGALSFQEWDAEALTSKAIPWLSEHRQRPVFAWCHFNDVHHPWFPRPAYAAQVGAANVSLRQAKGLVNDLQADPDRVWQNMTVGKMAQVLDLYNTAIRYTDQVVADFLSAAVKLEDTIVVLTADHGEEFGEHGGFHRNQPYDEMLRVPLILAGSGIPKGAVLDDPVSLIDLAPTLADYCGIEAAPEFQGQSLRAVMEGTGAPRPCLSYYDRRLVDGEHAPEGECWALRWKGWKYVRRQGGEELYDLGRDAGETHNLIGQEPAVAATYRAKLEAELQRFEPVEGAAEQIDLEQHDAIRERLKALGYVD